MTIKKGYMYTFENHNYQDISWVVSDNRGSIRIYLWRILWFWSDGRIKMEPEFLHYIELWRAKPWYKRLFSKLPYYTNEQ